MSSREWLLDLLDARHGVTCAVGAGGKKSLLQTLAQSHPGHVALTATVTIPPFPAEPGLDIIVAKDADLEQQVLSPGTSGKVAFACPADIVDRLSGVSPDTIGRIYRQGRFDAVFIKADGARMRWIKAPADNEPVLPAYCDRVLGLVSARAIGEPLGPRVAHRVGQLADIMQTQEGSPITPVHVGRLIAHPKGLGKGRGQRPLLPVINMVDDAQREQLARAAAEVALELDPSLAAVFLTRLQRSEDPLVAVIRR